MSSMEKLFDAYLQNSLELSAIALLLLAFSSLLERRYSAKCRYYLWAVIFIALLLPVRAKVTLTLPEVFQPIMPQNISTAASGTAAVADTVKVWGWHQYAGLLWVVGVFCFLGWHFYQHLHFLSAVRRWSEKIDNSVILKQFVHIKAELGIRDRITIKSCACIQTPMVIGLLRPVVLLPRINISPDELPLILRHELIHYKRKDLWYKVLMMITSAIHWFNPIVHLMVRSALNLCEISCDEEVLQGHDAKGRAQYGEAIIGVVRNRSAYHTALSTNFYSGTKGMKKRIYAMMDMSKKRFSPVLFIAIFIITICGTTAFAVSPAHAAEISQNSNKTATIAPEQNKTDSAGSYVQPSSASDAEQDNQEKQNDDGLTNDIAPVLQPTLENTSTKQSNELVSVSNEPRSVSGDLQFSENTPAKSSQAQPQNSDTNRLVPGDEQP